MESEVGYFKFAIILQRKMPIAYVSKSLSQSNYTQIEKELYAILFGFNRFK